MIPRGFWPTIVVAAQLRQPIVDGMKEAGIPQHDLGDGERVYVLLLAPPNIPLTTSPTADLIKFYQIMQGPVDLGPNIQEKSS
jgi:hypothetical protein